MPLFQPGDADAMLAHVQQHYLVLAHALGHDAPDAPTDLPPESPLRKDLLRLISVANGAFDRTDTNVRRAELALARVMRVLQASVPEARAALPDAFWTTTLGVLLARTRWWVSSDDLITISNAAALAFGDNSQANRMKITRAVERGELDWVPDPSVANPQHSRRVLRPQVERLRNLRTRPETTR